MCRHAGEEEQEFRCGGRDPEGVPFQARGLQPSVLKIAESRPIKIYFPVGFKGERFQWRSSHGCRHERVYDGGGEGRFGAPRNLRGYGGPPPLSRQQPPGFQAAQIARWKRCYVRRIVRRTAGGECRAASNWLLSWVRTMRLASWPTGARRRRRKDSVACGRRSYIYKGCTEKRGRLLPAVSEDQPVRSPPHHQALGGVWLRLFRAFPIDARLTGNVPRACARHPGCALHYQDEVIELNSENSRKVAASVAELRSALPKTSAESPSLERALRGLCHEANLTARIGKLDECCTAVVAEFENISRMSVLAWPGCSSTQPSRTCATNWAGRRSRTGWPEDCVTAFVGKLTVRSKP